MTYQQAFDKIVEKFNNADASKISDFAIQITFMDEDCNGIFYTQVKNGELFVMPYDYIDNDLAIAITKSALLSYLGGRSSLDKIIADGDAYVQGGDVSKMADLKSTIKKETKAEPKKTACKKTTKTEPKKTVAKKEVVAEPKKAEAPKAEVVKTEVKKAEAPKAASSATKKTSKVTRK